MREFNFVIRESLKNGLIRDFREPRNVDYCEELLNLKPTEFGAVSPEAVVDPTASTVAWPFPQLFRGKRVTLLCGSTVIYSVNESTWTLTPLVTYSINAPATPKSIVAGGPWHFADFYDSWILTNGSCQVFKAAFSTKTFVQDSVTIRTACNWWDGRLVYGGFAAGDSWMSRWQALFDAQDANVPTELKNILDYTKGVDKNWIYVGAVGGGDLLIFFDSYYNRYGNHAAGYDDTSPAPLPGESFDYSSTNPFIFHVLAQNTHAFRPMPYQGEVYCCLPMGKSLLVYGEDGIAAFSSAGEYVAQPDIAGLGSGVGLASRSAVGGNESGHMFVDQGGDLWFISPDLQATRLGYRHIFSEMLRGEIIVSFDPVEKDYWITDGAKCYIHSRTGLGGPIETMPTGLSRDKAGRLIGARVPSNTSFFRLLTHDLDIGESGTKHVSELQVDVEGAEQVRGRVSFLSDGIFRTTPWANMNPNGVIFPRSSFAVGRIGVLGNATGDVRLSTVEVRYQNEDRRFRRGTKGQPEAS